MSLYTRAYGACLAVMCAAVLACRWLYATVNPAERPPRGLHSLFLPPSSSSTHAPGSVSAVPSHAWHCILTSSGGSPHPLSTTRPDSPMDRVRQRTPVRDAHLIASCSPFIKNTEPDSKVSFGLWRDDGRRRHHLPTSFSPRLIPLRP